MLFSVIVPIYNVEKYLHQCIDSVLTQTYSDFELILVDDGSTDECTKIIDAYAAKDTRIIAIHKPNGGLVSARKAGLELAHGDYIVIVDGDDWIAAQALACIAQAIQKTYPDIVCYGHFIASENEQHQVSISDNKQLYNRQDIEKHLIPYLLPNGKKKRATTTLWGKAFKQQLFKKYQTLVDDRITMGEDGVVVYPCICEADSICFLPDALYHYRVNPTSMTRSRKKLIPWEGALLRIEHLKNHLPLKQYHMEQQLGCYAAHAVFNVILTQMVHREYREVKAEAINYLNSGDLMDLIRKGCFTGSISEKLAQLALRNRWFWLIKLYCMLRR